MTVIHFNLQAYAVQIQLSGIVEYLGVGYAALWQRYRLEHKFHGLDLLNRSWQVRILAHSRFKGRFNS